MRLSSSVPGDQSRRRIWLKFVAPHRWWVFRELQRFWECAKGCLARRLYRSLTEPPCARGSEGARRGRARSAAREGADTRSTIHFKQIKSASLPKMNPRHARAARPRKPRQKPNVGFAADSTPSRELPPPLAAPDVTTLLSRRGEPSRSLVAPLSPRCARISSSTCPSRPRVSPCRLPLRAPRHRTCTASAPARCGYQFHPRRIGLRQSTAQFGAGWRLIDRAPVIAPPPRRHGGRARSRRRLLRLRRPPHLLKLLVLGAQLLRRRSQLPLVALGLRDDSAASAAGAAHAHAHAPRHRCSASPGPRAAACTSVS